MQKAAKDLDALAESVHYLVSGLYSPRRVRPPLAFYAGLRAVADGLEDVGNRVAAMSSQFRSHSMRAAAENCLDLSRRATDPELEPRELEELLRSLTEAIDFLKMFVEMRAAS